MVENEIYKNWDMIVSKSKEDSKKYFMEYSINKQMDQNNLKSFLIFYCMKLELPHINDEDIEYTMKFYSNGSYNLSQEQFEEVVESLNVVKQIELLETSMTMNTQIKDN